MDIITPPDYILKKSKMRFWIFLSLLLPSSWFGVWDVGFWKRFQQSHQIYKLNFAGPHGESLAIRLRFSITPHGESLILNVYMNTQIFLRMSSRFLKLKFFLIKKYAVFYCEKLCVDSFSYRLHFHHITFNFFYYWIGCIVEILKMWENVYW